MTEIIRARDCVVYFKGSSITVTVSADMVASGWPGGQGVRWAGVVGDDRVVTYSQGQYGGFLIWGSDEEGDRFTAMTRNQIAYRHATMFFGGALISTSSYERYTYASRLAGPLVPLTYTPNEVLYLSLRGLWTNEDELTLSGSPLGPTLKVGTVTQVPKENNRYFLGIQTAM